VLIGLAVALGFLSAATAIVGPVQWRIGDVTVFRNSSILRPLFFAVVLVCIAGYSRNLVRLVTVTALALLLPLPAYAHALERLTRIDHPIREMRDCTAEVQASGVPAGRGVLAASGIVYHHGYYFYLWRLGPYIDTRAFSLDQTLERLTKPGAQTPVLIERADYEKILALATQDSAPDTPYLQELRTTVLYNSVRFDSNIAAVFPGPFGPCAQRLLDTSAFRIWDKTGGR
jgi:hypothetical protein